MRITRRFLHIILALLPGLVFAAETTTQKKGDTWVIENDRLCVSIAPIPGRIAVRDKVSGYEWRQPGEKETAPSVRVRLGAATIAPKIDGVLDEWKGEPTAKLTSKMTADAKKVDDDNDCSAEVWLSWDAANLYLAAKVKDDVRQFGPAGFDHWWERDALELWVDSRQVGLKLNPDGSQARRSDGPITDAQIVVRPEDAGYAVEAALPWKSLSFKPTAGGRFRFAVGVDDADAAEAREGQIYFPATWVHSNPSSFAEATLLNEKGEAPEVPPQPRLRNVRELPKPSAGVAFEADFAATKGKPNTVSVSMTVPDGTADLRIEASMPNNNAEIAGFTFLPPFLLDTPDGVLAIADYSNGHLYRLDLTPFPRKHFAADRLDMPWVGVCDLGKSFGYALIIETSDDAWLSCGSYRIGEREITAPQVGWHPSKGRFAYTRKLLYRFASNGGYVALAKAYRAYAIEQGLIVPFAEKLKKNPNIQRLFGAPDVWGDATLRFAQQAKALGVEKMLIHGRASAEDMKAINDLGYLTSEYDNYTDILQVDPGKEVDSNHAALPDDAVLKSDGQRMTAWLTWDKKTQYMKRCPALWVATAQKVIPKILDQWPFVGRFIDVTTAEALYECYDEKHPLTKTQKRQCGVGLLGYVRSNGLVVGGEHGIWWGVPVQDYIEGMMSGGYASWPAGHLIHPKTKEEEFTGPQGYKLRAWEGYEKWGIGHEWRAPLWELVFHDCIVSTWYWGDASDWLLDAAPEVTPKKDAFNVLYGTIPLLWANGEGSWRKAQDVFLRTYRNTCKLHEVVAGAEMLSHEFVTPDHAVQRTKFSDGTEAVVNFGEKAFEVEVGGKRHLLPQNGFAVRGPHIEQSLALVDGRAVTTIRSEGYLFSDAGGRAVAARAVGDDGLRVTVSDPAAPAELRPADIAPRWEMKSTRAFALDEKGERAGRVEWKALEGDRIAIGPLGGASAVDLVCRSQAFLPDLCVDASGVVVNPASPRQGEKAQVQVVVSNDGGSDASGVEVAFFADAIRPDRKLGGQVVSLASGERKTISVEIDTVPLDGSRRILAALDPEHRVAELCVRNNAASQAIEVAPDFARWPHKRAIRVESAEIEREDEPVVVPISLPQADPASVRVVECDEAGNLGKQIPAQFDAGEAGNGDLCFLLAGRTPAGATRRFRVLWCDMGEGQKSRFLSPLGRMWDDTTKVVEGDTYRVELSDGMLTQLAAKGDGVAGKPFISMLMLSSKETGWGDEPGKVERFEVVHAGPVRTQIGVRKALKASVVYDKVYTFYPRRFDIAISVNKPAGGLYSRAYYLRAGDYINDQGFHARVDGKGDGEDVYGKGKNPKWYAVIGDDWSHACIALSPFDHTAYWDSGMWGGIGLVARETKDIRMSYVVRPGKQESRFAEDACRDLTTPVKVTVEEGRP